MNVLIADKFEEEGIAALREAGCAVTIRTGLKDAALADAVRESECEVLIVRSTKVGKEVLAASSALSLIIRAGSGVDTIDVESATTRGIRVCNCPGMNSVAVAELTIGLMIALDRRIVDETDDLRRGVWNKKEYSKARGLKGRTLGIVGMGRIGYEVARRAAAFEMRLIYSDVIARPDLEAELGIRRVELPDLLREADFVTLHVPGGSDTTHLIGAEQLALMKPTAFLLNCARGGIVDEKALAVAIGRGALAGAALDVYEIEPGAADTEFKDPTPKVPRVYGTHHIGASTEQAQLAVAEEVVRIVTAYMTSGKYLNCVNPPKAAIVL
ncbi:MAG: hydroxyacid dehydrogenase [Planctomycetes bacterium]|nr:hydroxyacid dehydrogenase [Planctomycetota bacterium]